MIATTIVFSSTNYAILLPFIFIFLLVNVPFCLAQSLQVVSVIGNRLHITDDDIRGLCSCFIPSNKVGVDSERQSDIELNDNPMLRASTLGVGATAILKPEASRDSNDIELADTEDDAIRNSEIGRGDIITAGTIFLRPTLKKQVGNFNLDYRGSVVSNSGDTAKLPRRTTVRFADTETTSIESSTRVIDNEAVSRITDNSTFGPDESGRVIDNEAVSRITDNTVGPNESGKVIDNKAVSRITDNSTVGPDESGRVIDSDSVSRITDNTVGPDESSSSKRRTTVSFADTEQSTAAATRITDDRIDSGRRSSRVAGTIRDTISVLFKRSTSKRSSSLPSSINESDEDL